ncbi:hypothetical protein AGMMS49944_30030 [Spirochaetia bacterium]|nr:hypothetical protein AGMMS49944_30030 [Spirochaetia bacterium]
MTIEQTIEILADHRLILDLPQEVPAGKAKIKVFIKPFSKKPKKDCNGRTDGIPLGDGMIYYPAPPGYTLPPPDPELAALIKEAEEQAERRRTDPVYRAQFVEDLRKCQEGGPIFGGMDGMEFPQETRQSCRNREEFIAASDRRLAAEKDDPSLRSFKHWHGILKDSKAWGRHVDVEAEIRNMRDEWPDYWGTDANING